jgi:hypothetical protein
MQYKRIVRRVTACLAGVAASLAIFGLAFAPAALASPNATVSPRVQCGGFNGHIAWSPWWQSGYIHVWGIVWSNCRSYATLELSYDSGFQGETEQAGITFGYGRDSEGVNYWAENALWPVGGISLRVCTSYPSGRSVCGRPWHV